MLIMFTFESQEVPESYAKSSQNEIQNNLRSKLLSSWDHISERNDVFRYKLKHCLKKIVLGKYSYYLELNPERATKRRAPFAFNNVKQEFTHDQFNFTKVGKAETLSTIAVRNEQDLQEAEIMVNVSPICRYHSLLIPSKELCLPQIMTFDSLILSAQLMFLWPDSDLRIAFNSLCALASVNHLHYHLLFVEDKLPVETVKCIQLNKHVFQLAADYPSKGFCFQITTKHEINTICKAVYKVVEYFVENNIAHNLIMTRGESYHHDDQILRIILWPRKSSFAAKQRSDFNIAVLEMSGFFPIFNQETFRGLSAEDIERELSEVSVDNFDDLSEAIKKIFEYLIFLFFP